VALLGGGLIAVAVGVPALGMFLGPTLQQAPQPWRPVGTVNTFKIGETVTVIIQENSAIPWTGVTGQAAVWLRRDGPVQFTAFAVNCTHLGCPVRWEPGARLFLCPCHGGAFYADGSVAAGPPPHALNPYPVRVNQGNVEIQAIGLTIS
jgi:menaquinol-cytochrome c reductase iron-sulfur subunit